MNRLESHGLITLREYESSREAWYAVQRAESSGNDWRDDVGGIKVDLDGVDAAVTAYLVGPDGELAGKMLGRFVSARLQDSMVAAMEIIASELQKQKK